MTQLTATSATAVTVVAGVVVATAAAVRSTWSPCGLSMLSTITPQGEHARGHSYRATAGWFVVGASIGGACLGLLVAAGAAAVRLLPLTASGRVWSAGVAALVCAASDCALFGHRLPFHRRQVNERWLDGYRPWVYGAGFGWQIGTGLATYITSAAVYLVVVTGALTASPLAGLLVGVWFGLLRGLAVLLTRRVRSPRDLLAFHRRFEAALPAADRAVRGTEVVVALGAAAVLATTASVVLLALPALAIATAVAARRWSRRPGLSTSAAVRRSQRAQTATARRASASGASGGAVTAR